MSTLPPARHALRQVAAAPTPTTTTPTPTPTASAPPLRAAFIRAFPRPRLSRDLLLLTAFTLLALLLRLWALGDRALHHDESLHATYSWYLMGRANPEYHYDPMMHGPLQFHMIAFFYSLFGSSPFTARLWSASAGTALVLLPWLLRRRLGPLATYALMALLCLSPVALYFSRFAREDMQYALFTFLLVAALLRFFTDFADGLPGAHRWLLVAAVAFVLAYAAKESIYLTCGTLALFLLGALALELLPALPWPDPSRPNRWLWLAAPLLWALLLEGGGLLAGHSLLLVAVLPTLLVALFTCLRLVTVPPAGLLSAAIRQVPRATWALAAAIIVCLFVLLYWPIGDPVSWGIVPGAHTQNTTNVIDGISHAFTYSTDGLLGGLLYWQSQVPVARGGQPWYYYFFLLGLYEWTVVLFALVGTLWILLRHRTFFTCFLLWWAYSSLAVYAWASEKMPWNTVHLVVPLAVVAALGLARALTLSARFWRSLAWLALLVTGTVSLHNSFTLSFVNGANPVELLVYVQTSQDVPAVYSQLQRLQAAQHGPLHLAVDSADTWPWAFYLRDTSAFITDRYPATPADYAGLSEPVLLVDGANYTQLQSQFAQQYVAFHEVLRWWGPEEYKTYAERTYPYHFDAKGTPIPPSGQLLPRTQRLGYFLSDLRSPTSWSNILQWEVQRRPFTPTAWAGDANQLIFYLVVRKDLVPFLSPALQQQAAAQLQAAQRADPFYSRTSASAPLVRIGPSLGGSSALHFAGPAAVAADGTTYALDPVADSVDVFGPAGTLLRRWGSAGSGPGQFHFLYGQGGSGSQTGGIAIGTDGSVYVADTWNHRIEQFTPAGRFVRAFGGPTAPADQARPKGGEFYGPRGLAVAPNGDLYIADTGNRRIQVYSPSGQFRFAFGRAGSGPGQFLEPASVVVSKAGVVAVADYWNRRVQTFTLAGQPTGQFAVPAWVANSYDEPQLAVDTAGRYYLPDPAGGRLLVYTAAGVPVAALGGELAGAPLLSKPLSAAITPSGKLLVSDGGTNRLLLFAPPH